MKMQTALGRFRVKFVRAAALALLASGAALLGGCASYKVPISYAPPAGLEPRADTARVFVGTVTDSRGTDANWLGAIRGGFGNPLKKLYTEQDMAVVVKGMIEDALGERGMLSEAADGSHRLDVTLDKIDTSNLVNGEAHAHLSVSVVAVDSQAVVYTQSYLVDRSNGGVGAGVFGSVNRLAEFANETINQAIDKMLDDPGLYAAVGGSGQKLESDERSTEARLKKIEDLHAAGLITDEEYEQARGEILDDL